MYNELRQVGIRDRKEISIMNSLVQKVLKAARNYTLLDYAGFKTTLIFLGVLLGAYFSEFFLNHITWVWIIFILSYLWIMYRTFVKHMR